MFTTQTRRIAQTDFAQYVADLDSIDAAFTAYENTLAATTYPEPTEDTLSVEEAEFHGII